MSTPISEDRGKPCPLWCLADPQSGDAWYSFNGFPSSTGHIVISIPIGWTMGISLSLGAVLTSTYGRILGPCEAAGWARRGLDGFRLIEGTEPEVNPVSKAEPPADNPPRRLDLQRRRMTRCQSDDDGDCAWEHCPQVRDGDPKKSGRHCPWDKRENEEEDWPI